MKSEPHALPTDFSGMGRERGVKADSRFWPDQLEGRSCPLLRGEDYRRAGCGEGEGLSLNVLSWGCPLDIQVQMSSRQWIFKFEV